MPDDKSWLEALPWKGIGAGVGAVVLTIGGGIWGKVDSEKALETATAPTNVQQEHMLRHFDWQSSCPVIAENGAEGVWVRKCPSDGCRMLLDVRGGLQRVFFAVAPSEVPTAPMLLGTMLGENISRFDFPGGEVRAAYPYTCLSDHGQPNAEYPLTNGSDLGNGWFEQYLNWRDGCRMKRQFHGPSQSATAWQWDRCAEAHY